MRIPKKALKEIKKVLKYGAKKYGKNNWRSGWRVERYQARLLYLVGAQAHIDEIKKGNEVSDKELLHAAQAIVKLIFYIELEEPCEPKSH